MTEPQSTPAQWPVNAVSNAGDLAVPAAQLLVSLNLLETADDAKAGTSWRGTPWSLQVITSGASAASKLAGTTIAVLGGGAAVWAALKAFWLNSDPNLRLAYTGAVAVIVAAVAIALALIVRGDVHARAVATAAEYRARARVADAFLHTAATVSAAPYLVKKKGGPDWSIVLSFTPHAQHGLVAVTKADIVAPDEIEGLVQMPFTPPPDG